MSEQYTFKHFQESTSRNRWPSNVIAVRVIDRESTDWTKSSNGGDYEMGHILLVEKSTKRIIGGRWWTSADFDYCAACGSFQQYSDHYESCEWFQFSETHWDGHGQILKPLDINWKFFPL